jgi:hypothetical protein
MAIPTKAQLEEKAKGCKDCEASKDHNGNITKQEEK